MQTKQELLQELKDAVSSGAVTRQDVESLFSENLSVQDSQNSIKKFSVVQSLFYITGIILFAAVLSVIAQTWDDGTSLHLILTVVMGSLIWLASYVMDKDPNISEVKRGMADALLLTGSLLLITGGYIITNLFGAYGHVDFFEAAPTLLVLAAVHAGFYYIVRRDLLYLMSILLAVASVGSLLFGILRDADASGSAWAIALIALAGLLSWAAHILSRTIKVASRLQSSYDKPAIIISLMTMYIASFGDFAGFWYLALASAICGVFYLSIVSKQKVLLGTASTFLVLVTITVAFRYFSAFGVTTSLIVSALGILAAAALASQLSKKYLS